MSIKTRIFGAGADDPLLPVKKKKGSRPHTLNSVIISRAECRRGNARGRDRHRLMSEQAVVRQDGRDHSVELVNLSAGGAMVARISSCGCGTRLGWCSAATASSTAPFAGSRATASVLSSRTRHASIAIDDDRNDLLRAVIRKSFPDAADIDLEYPKRRIDDDPSVDPEGAKRRSADRHPLIWTGVIYYDNSNDYQAEPVRLRNISVTGALVQSGNPLPKGRWSISTCAVQADLRQRSNGLAATSRAWNSTSCSTFTRCQTFGRKSRRRPASQTKRSETRSHGRPGGSARRSNRSPSRSAANS